MKTENKFYLLFSYYLNRRNLEELKKRELSFPQSSTYTVSSTSTPISRQPTSTTIVFPTTEPWKSPTPPRSLFTPPRGAYLVANSENSSRDEKDIVAGHARNLAIPSGYKWEVYNLPSTTRYLDVEGHYTNILVAKGYRKIISEQGMNEVYLLKFKSDKRYVVVQFWGDIKSIMIFSY